MPNPLKRDPSRTTMLRKKYMSDMKRRFAKVSRAIEELIVKDDALGLDTSKPLTFQQQVSKQAWRFKSDANKVKEYRKWLQQQIDAKILTVHAVSGQPWTAIYAESAYRKGMMKAYTQVHKQALAGDVAFYEGGKAQFLREAFASPISLSKIELMYTRAFDELKGVTAVMGQQMSRILTAGMIKGDGPRVIARELRKNVATITSKRALVIARTEVIYAHAEGQLDAFERLGVEELGLMAEWLTAGDNRVCENCGALEGHTFTIEEARGMLPLHANCFIDGQIPIYTFKGWMAIKDVKKGSLVLTHRGRFRKVTEIIRTPMQMPDMVSIYTRKVKKSYTTLTVTEDHPVLLNGKWMLAKYAKKGMSISYLAGKCRRCEKSIPHYRTYCSLSCCSLDTTDKQWSSEKHRKLISKKTSAQLKREYKEGIRDGKKITKAAHKAMRKLVKEGKCPLQRLDVQAKSRLVTNTPEMRRQSSERMKRNNPMYIPGVAKKVAEKNRKRLLLHPETHPNMVMAKRGFISSLERIMKCILEGKGLKFVYQFPIGRYFVDFVLPKYKLAIEVDGLYWHQDKEKDLKRQRYIERKGWTVIRFDENQMKNIQNVKDELSRVLMNHNKQYHFLDMKVVKVEKWKPKIRKTLFNLSVEDDESYIAKGFVVHNCRCAWMPFMKGVSRRRTKEEIREKLKFAIPRWPSTKRKIETKPFVASEEWKNAESYAIKNGNTIVPENVKQAVDIQMDGVQFRFGDWKVGDVGDIVMEKSLRENWGKALNSRKGFQGIYYKVPGNALKDIDKGRRLRLQNAINDNGTNSFYRKILNKKSHGQQPVILRRPPQGVHYAAEQIGGTSHVMDSVFMDALKDATPLPGKLISTELGGLQSALRHEYGHTLYDLTSKDFKTKWISALTSHSVEDIQKGITGFSATKMFVDDEAYCELFAMRTSRLWDASKFPVWVQDMVKLMDTSY